MDNKKYEELKNKQEKSELDQYIIDRKNIIFLTMRLTPQAQKILNQSEINLKSEEFSVVETIDLGDGRIIHCDTETDGEFDYEESKKS